MPLTFKESNFNVVALISLKQNQYDNLKAIRRFFLQQSSRLQGSDATYFIILSAYKE